MQSETFRSLVKPSETVHRVIWLAYIAAVPIYVCVAYTLFGRTASRVARPLPRSLTISFVAISLLMAVLAPYVPRLLLPDSRLREVLDRQPDLGATISDEQRLLVLVPNFFVGFIVRLAFNESIALFGLVLAFISRSFVAVLPFAIVSLALNWMVPLPLDEALKRTANFGLHDEMPTQPR